MPAMKLFLLVCPLYLFLLPLQLRDNGVIRIIAEQHNTLSQIECLDLHIREITLSDYRGNTPEIDFAKFFVKNARVLKVMRFGIKTGVAVDGGILSTDG